jgi:hypothetical protein
MESVQTPTVLSNIGGACRHSAHTSEAPAQGGNQ